MKIFPNNSNQITKFIKSNFQEIKDEIIIYDSQNNILFLNNTNTENLPPFKISFLSNLEKFSEDNFEMNEIKIYIEDEKGI